MQEKKFLKSLTKFQEEKKLKLLEKEKPAMYKLRKKLVASKDLKSGMILTKDDIAIKIPGDGTPRWLE